MNKTTIKNHTDANGVIWGQKVVRTGKWGKWTFSENVGKPFKVSDPNYTPDWSAGPISAEDEAMRRNLGIAAGVTGLAAVALVVGTILA